MAAEDYYNPKASKGPSCSAGAHAARLMPTVNYHDTKACKVQARRAAARRASIVRKRDVQAKAGDDVELPFRDDLHEGIYLPPHEAKSRGLDGGKWAKAYGPAAEWWVMEFGLGRWGQYDLCGYRRVIDGHWIPYFFDKHWRPWHDDPKWQLRYEPENLYDWDDYAAACALNGHADDKKWRCPLERIIVYVRAALIIGQMTGWLCRARALQRWRDRGEVIGEVIEPPSE